MSYLSWWRRITHFFQWAILVNQPLRLNFQQTLYRLKTSNPVALNKSYTESWCFRNPKANHRLDLILKPLVNNGANYQALVFFAGFSSTISMVSSKTNLTSKGFILIHDTSPKDSCGLLQRTHGFQDHCFHLSFWHFRKAQHYDEDWFSHGVNRMGLVQTGFFKVCPLLEGKVL